MTDILLTFLRVVLERGWERVQITTRKKIRKRRNQIEAFFSFLVPNFTGPSLAREQYLPLGMQWRQVARTEDLSPGNGVIHLALYTAHLWTWARCRLRAQEVAPKYSPVFDELWFLGTHQWGTLVITCWVSEWMSIPFTSFTFTGSLWGQRKDYQGGRQESQALVPGFLSDLGQVVGPPRKFSLLFCKMRQCGRPLIALFVVVVVQSLSHVWLFETSWTAARQASLSFIISQNFAQIHVHWLSDAI